MLNVGLTRAWRLVEFAVIALVATVLGRVPTLQARPAQMTMPTASAEARAIAFAQARGLDYVPGEVIFKFKDNTPAASQQRALMAIRSHPLLSSVRWAHKVGFIHDDTQPDANVLAQQLSEQAEIEYAFPNYIRHVTPLAARATRSTAPTASRRVSPPILGARSAIGPATGTARPSDTTFTPNDPDYASLQWNFPLIGMPLAWGINPGGSPNITVAVVDTGITSVAQTLSAPLWNGSAFVNTQIPFDKSPDLSGNRIVNPQDLVFLTQTNDVLDMDGHSTHVASTIGEDTNNGLGLAGIAFNVKIMPIKACTGYWEAMIEMGQAGIPGFASQDAGGCPDSAIIQGIEMAADQGARVINLSLGGDQPDSGLQTAIEDAVTAGAFVSIAMGNDFQNGNPTEYPAFYAAAINGAMSVASVDSTMAHASYSSTGSYCEIAAPGGDGPSSDLNSFVWQVTVDFNDSLPTLLAPRFDRYAEIGMEGTSMATPHVSGMAALVLSQYPNITPAAIEALIKATALHLGTGTGPNDQFGFGLVQARSELFGLGIAK